MDIGPLNIKRKYFSDSSFTLIELLVVVAIVGILTSMLLPALAKARGAVKQAACINNIKSISLALIMYTDDNDDYFTTGTSNPRSVTWDDLLGVGGYDGRSITMGIAAQSKIEDPVNGSRVYYCPSANFDYLDGSGRPVRTYSTNRNLMFEWVDGGAVKISQVSSPSKTIMVFDNHDQWAQGWRAAAFYTYLDDSRRHSHHNKAYYTVMAFVDGSAKPVHYPSTAAADNEATYELD